MTTRAIIRFNYVDEVTGEEETTTTATIEARSQDDLDYVIGNILGILVANAEHVRTNDPALNAALGVGGEEVIH